MKEKDLIESLTRKAGETLMKHFRQDWALLKERSTAKEAATRYDKEVDNLIVEQIKRYYPHHSLLTEEGGFLKGEPDWLWIVDSLDGTGNFANFNPFFSVCLALMHKSELLLGAVYAPAIDEFYFAEQGRGAYLNNVSIQVAAGVLLVQEAGGRVSDFQGNPWQPRTSDLLFSNKKLHHKLLGLLSS
jgi:myo-inositol-1(or 4)-monophosphatase